MFFPEATYFDWTAFADLKVLALIPATPMGATIFPPLVSESIFATLAFLAVFRVLIRDFFWMDIVAPFFLKRNSCLVAGAFRTCKSYAKSIFGCFLSAIADRDTKN